MTLDKLTSSIRRAQKHLFNVKDVEMVRITQSDLGTFQLIFKNDNSANNA